MPMAEASMDRHSGFTVVELIIALLIGSILTSIALSNWGSARASMAVRGARNSFVTLEARARATAIEKGTTIRLNVSVSGDSAWISDGTTTLERVRFADEFHVNLRSSEGDFRLCMSSRGYGDEGCNSFSNAVTLQFWQTADSSSVQILPLGQLVY
jgi:prepilin-type N-terminal cleavage/methylation domain-containing protein